MAGSNSTRCCRCFVSTTISLGLAALFMWLRNCGITYSIDEFYVPALNKTANQSRNTTIAFDLKMENRCKYKGIYYDAINVSLYYGQSRSIFVGNVSIPGFYQGHDNKAHRKESVKSEGVPWKTALRSNGSKAVFRVDLGMVVRYKIMASKSKLHNVRVGGAVEVDAEGKKANKKGIKLISKAPQQGRYSPCVPMFLLSVLLFCW
ncbi:hypothetical protein HHK36_002083 [Tetracentron sinense]|uniref:Late embryogenesis abundant protein LEA-2 subgroup domain-containing protein n=1 Tax=Tetracentron sinense TaxID=13715 RepID=A0A834ZUT9_TETSI|nr:hypothetical protein HHK36_002083 [Tetracentron sinense]